jgi:hypothetical protein
MMSLWELGNKVSEIGCRLHGIKCVAEMQGEADSDNMNSGVSWTIAEMCDIYSDKLEELSSEIMSADNEQQERIRKLEAIVAKYELKKKKKKEIDLDGRC